MTSTHAVVPPAGPYVQPVLVERDGESGPREGPWIVTPGERVVVDFGAVTMGFVEIEMDGPQVAVQLAYSEFRQFLGPDGDGLGAPFGTDAHPWSRVDRFTGSGWHSTAGKRELRYLLITAEEPGEVRSIRVRHTLYRVSYDGRFSCSDELLNKAYLQSAYCGELATVSENGSPWMLTVPFDRVLFMADLQIQAIAGYYHSSDYTWLMRNSLERFGCIQNPDGSLPAASSHLVTPVPGDPGPPDGWRVPEEGPDPRRVLGSVGGVSLYDIRIDSFTAFWVLALSEHYRYCGDGAFAAAMLPVARRALDYLFGRTDEDGLYFEPEDVRTDPGSALPFVANWSPGDIAAGVDALSNAVLIRATLGLADLEEALAGDDIAAESLRSRADSLRRALLTALWDDEVGAMRLNTADPLRDHTGDAVAGSLAFEVLDNERARASIEFLDRVLRTPFGTLSSEHTDNPYRAGNIQGYINTLDSLGRVRNGDGAGAVSHIRDWWGHMLANGPGTGWFSWNNDGSVPPGAFAYTPWTTALPALVEGVLGIRPRSAGYRRWLVAPLLAEVSWAEGSVPTPHGALACRWRRDSSGFTLTVDAPDDTVGTVILPRGELGETYIPPELSQVVVEDERIVIDGVTGTAEFSVRW